MQINEIELLLLVRDHPITEYPHNGKIYVEGRAGSEYEIEVRNHTWQRVETVLSVDGLSVTDGKPAGTQSTGYLIPSRGTIRIPGWTLNSTSIAKFAFASQAQSYATQMTGDARNNGVIGAMVFREKIIPQPWVSSYERGINISASSPSGGLSNMAARGITSTSATNYVAQNMGTAFGESAQFTTRTVAFQRGDLLATLLCHYNEKKGLKERGIRFERRRPRQQHEPEAFPAITGCQPPPNWTG